MVKNRVLYILLFGAALAFSIAYRSRISAVLLVAVSVYPIIAAVLTALSLLTLKIGFGERRAVYEKNEQFELALYLKNNFLFPFAPAELTCVLPDSDTGLFMQKQVFVSVYPFKKMRIFVPCMHRYRGSYYARVQKLTVYDPFKIIRLSIKQNVRTQLVFLPRKIMLSELSAVFCCDRGALSEPSRSNEREDFSHIREYAQGDLLQLVHWKLTAKQQELMVRQYDGTRDLKCTILCNFAAGGGATPSSVLKRTDAVIEATLAVALSATKADALVTVDLGFTHDNMYEIRDIGSFERFYELMTVLPHSSETAEFAALVKRSISVENSALFLITADLNSEIHAAAEAAARASSGTVAVMYVNCTGRPLPTDFKTDSRYILAEVSADTENSLNEAAEKIAAECYSARNS